MEYFVISDIHSHYDSMITALNKAMYDSTNNNHHLLVLGDLFDRGKQANEVLNYLHTLHQEKKVTIILGNHDTFLLDFLRENYTRTAFNVERNGFGKTLMQLAGVETIPIELKDIHNRITKRYPYLEEWIESFPLYLEKGDYIFVHGGIDGRLQDWKKMTSFRDFVWNREYELEPVPGKTVVAGHHRVATIRKSSNDYRLLFSQSPELFDIMYLEGKILIDRFVEKSNEINVLQLKIET